jgi:hypothetical protein
MAFGMRGLEPARVKLALIPAFSPRRRRIVGPTHRDFGIRCFGSNHPEFWILNPEFFCNMSKNDVVYTFYEGHFTMGMAKVIVSDYRNRTCRGRKMNEFSSVCIDNA